MRERKIEPGEPFKISMVEATEDDFIKWDGWIVRKPKVADIFETGSMGFGPVGGW